MGYLNNSTITVDAILTKKGRELLARGRDEFVITQFALADDEVDYDLYNPDHPLGTAYYGAAIENLPVTEALPDETQMMKYKLMTLNKGLGSGNGRVPVVAVANGAPQPINAGQTFQIQPTTYNYPQANAQLGYTAVLSDSDVATISATGTVPFGPSVPQFIGDNEAAQSISVAGLGFAITGKQNATKDMTATITLIGNETGGSVVVPFTVLKYDGIVV
jgi:hypothetical protein